MKQFLTHLFLPYHTNNHRAKLLHHSSIVTLIAILLFTAGILRIIGSGHPQVLGQAIDISTQALLQYTNQARASVGMPPLQANTLLTLAAQQKAAYMFSHNFWAHNAPDGKTPWDFMKEQGYVYVYAGENLARGYSNAQEVITAWMNSPEHRENLLSPNYTEVGFGVGQGDLTGEKNTILIVQEFGNRTELVSKAKPGSPADMNPAVLSESKVPNQVIKNQPLVDVTVMRTIGIILVGCFLLILVIDMIIVERRQIERLFVHNIDHIAYLLFILGILLLIGRGILY